jgi:hypothetical protein
LATSTIGTPLAFSGSLRFVSGTQYVIGVLASASDKATTSGAATLTGAIATVQFAVGSYISKQYIILTAGSICGTFSSLVADRSVCGRTRWQRDIRPGRADGLCLH